MVSMTLSIPKDIKQHMDTFPEINWSEVARDAIKKKLTLLEQFKEFTKESTMTEKDALKLGREISKSAMKRHETRS